MRVICRIGRNGCRRLDLGAARRRRKPSVEIVAVSRRRRQGAELLTVLPRARRLADGAAVRVERDRIRVRHPYRLQEDLTA